MIPLVPLVFLVSVVLCAIGIFALLRPLLARLALRNALRRRGEAVLVVFGCALGTAIITGSLLVGDTLDVSLRDKAPERLGPVDAVVATYAVPIATAAEDALTQNPPASSDGLLSMTTADATLSTPQAKDGEREVVPGARLLEVDFEEARDFGGDPAATGIAGPTPGAGEVVLGVDAADALGVGPGDSVEAYAYGQYRLLRIARVLPRVGVAGYATGFDGASNNAFVEPGAISGLTGGPGASENSRPSERLLLVSAMGGVFGGAERADALVGELRDRLDTLVGYEIRPVKQDLLDTAAEEGDAFAELFLSLGAFAVLAGAALLVNMLVMLAEERRRELGVLRSLGMSRREMVGAFVLEGTLYSVAATLLGALGGIGVARLVVWLAGGVFSSSERGGVEDVRFGFEPATLLAGSLGGFVLSLAVVAVASFWIGRMTIVEAIKDLARGADRRPSPRTLAVAVFGFGAFSVASAVSIFSGNDAGSLAFPCLALACLAVVALRSNSSVFGLRPPRRFLAAGCAVAVMLWAVFSFALLGLDDGDVTLFVVQGVALTLAAIALVGGFQNEVCSLLRRMGGGLTLRLAVAYPSARRFRTGTTLLAYSLIVFTLVFSSALSGIFSSQKDELLLDEGGGFDVLVSTSSADPVPPEDLAAEEGVEAAAPLSWTIAGFRVVNAEGGDGKFRDWAVSGFNRALLDGGPPGLEQFDRSEYPTEEAVWRAVEENPDLAVADVAFLQRGGGPPESNVAVGQEVEIKNSVTGETVRREVVAVSAAGAAFSGVMVSRDSLAQLVANPVVNRHYLSVSGGSDPEAVAAGLQRSFLANGLEARSFERVVDEALRDQEAFFDLIEGYLALGLLVGIAGLGVVMARAVRDRRRQIGVLRALGFPASSVRNAFLLEAALVAIEGVLIGAVLALATSYQLAVKSTVFGETGASFSVPWAQLVALLVGVLAASLLATLAVAFRAAAAPPSVVLRAVEEGAV